MTGGRGRGRPSKPSPNEVLDEAKSRLNQRFIIYKVTDNFLLQNDELRQARVVEAEEALHALAVTLEDTISRWFIAAVKNNGRPALQSIEKEIQKDALAAANKRAQSRGVTDRYKIQVKVTLTAPGDPTLKPRDVESVINPDGKNLTFSQKNDWIDMLALT